MRCYQARHRLNALDGRHVRLDVDPEFHQHIGRTTPAGHLAIAMFGNRHTRRRRDQGRRRADVESPRAIASRTASVDQTGP